MTVRDLISVLEQACEGENTQEVQVRLAMQPQWPFEYDIDPYPDITLLEVDRNGERAKVIYLPEGTQLGYLPGEAQEALGWK